MDTESREQIDHKDLVFMCYMGSERSRAIQRVYQEAGKNVDVFEGGTRRLNRMSLDDVKKDLAGRYVYLIYDYGSKRIEFQSKERAVDMLELAGIGYRIVDEAFLVNTASELGRNYYDYLV